MARSPHSAFDEPLDVVCVDGEVVILGPENLHGSLSAEAARRSAKRLERSAEAAQEAPPPGPETP